VYELEGCLPELTTLLPEGFEVRGHEIVLWGRCRACRTPARKPSSYAP
jgi:Fe2+ or Zn2+ uptake regulation protein